MNDKINKNVKEIADEIIKISNTSEYNKEWPNHFDINRMILMPLSKMLSKKNIEIINHDTFNYERYKKIKPNFIKNKEEKIIAHVYRFKEPTLFEDIDHISYTDYDMYYIYPDWSSLKDTTFDESIPLVGIETSPNGFRLIDENYNKHSVNCYSNCDGYYTTHFSIVNNKTHEVIVNIEDFDDNPKYDPENCNLELRDF